MRKREQSVLWWNSLTIVERWQIMLKSKDVIGDNLARYRYSSELTGREIESLWNKEGQPETVITANVNA